MADDDRRIGVIIPTLNGGLRLLRAVESIASSVPPEALELVVVVDGADAEALDQLPPAVRLHRLGRNVGFAAAVNAGVAQLRTDPGWIALVNDDVLVAPEWYAALQLDDVDRAVGGLACEVRFDPARDRVNSRGIGLASGGWFFEVDSGAPAEAEASPGPLLGPAGAVGLYRREVWLALGGLDESLIAYGEDVDLAWRMRRSGWRTELRRDAIAYHAHGATAGQRSPLKSYLSSRNRSLLRAKFLTPRERLRHAWIELLRESLAFAREVHYGTSRHWLRGKVHALRQTRQVVSAGRWYRMGTPPPVSPPDTVARAIRRKLSVDRLTQGR